MGGKAATPNLKNGNGSDNENLDGGGIIPFRQMASNGKKIKLENSKINR